LSDHKKAGNFRRKTTDFHVQGYLKMRYSFRHSSLVDPRTMRSFLLQMGSFHLSMLVDLKMVASFLQCITPVMTASSHLITQADPKKLISSHQIIQVDLKKVDNSPHTTLVDLRMVVHSLLIGLGDFQMAIFHQCITDLLRFISDLHTT